MTVRTWICANDVLCKCDLTSLSDSTLNYYNHYVPYTFGLLLNAKNSWISWNQVDFTWNPIEFHKTNKISQDFMKSTLFHWNQQYFIKSTGFHKFHWNQQDFMKSNGISLKCTGISQGLHEIQQDFTEINRFYEFHRILQDFMKSNKSVRFNDEIWWISWNP